jgi:hypothetical protein
MKKISLLFLALILGIYSQAAPIDVEEIHLYSSGEVEYNYKIEVRACNCFFQAVHTRSKSVSISPIPCVSLRSSYFSTSERVTACIKK